MKLLEKYPNEVFRQTQYLIEYDCGCTRTVKYNGYCKIKQKEKDGLDIICGHCSRVKGKRHDKSPEMENAAEILAYVDQHWIVFPESLN